MAEEIKKEEPLRKAYKPRRKGLLHDLADIDGSIPYENAIVCARIGKNATTNPLVEKNIISDLDHMFNRVISFKSKPYNEVVNCRRIAMKTAAIELNKAGKYSKKLTDQEIDNLVSENETYYEPY